MMFDISLGTKVNPHNGSEECRGLYDAEKDITVSYSHFPTFEELENDLKEVIELYKCDGVYGITEHNR